MSDKRSIYIVETSSLLCGLDADAKDKLKRSEVCL